MTTHSAWIFSLACAPGLLAAAPGLAQEKKQEEPAKLWGGRFSGETDPDFAAFGASFLRGRADPARPRTLFLRD